MRDLVKISLLSLCIFVFKFASAQTDTTFWFAAPDISQVHGDRPVIFRFATFQEAAKVKISLPGLSSVVQELNIPPNSERNYNVTRPDFLEVKAGNIQNNGILIESSAKITAYYEIVGAGNNTDIYALKGKYALGKDFVVPFQTRFPNQTELNAYSSVTIVATEDNTEIAFVPSRGVILHFGEDTIRMTLNKGQTYNFRALDEATDAKLAGSRIFSSKPIAVSTSDDSVLDGGNWDLIGDQIIPFKYAGSKYVLPAGFLAISSKNAMSFSTLTNTISLDSSNNFSQTIFNQRPQLVDFPDTVIVAFIDSEGGNSGSELGGAILPPLTCSGSREVSFVRSSDRPFYLYLVYRTSAKDSFLLNNKPFVIESDLIYKLDNNLSYVKVNLEEGDVPIDQANRLSNTSAPFHLAIANGSGNTGFQLGYFSNFRNELLDTVYACEKYASFEAFRANLDIYGSMTMDTINAAVEDSIFVNFKVVDEYCVTEDSAWVIQSKAPEIPVADSLFICNSIDSVLVLDEYKVVYDDFFVQNTWKLKNDSVKIFLENKAGCKSAKTVQITYLDSVLVNFPEDSAFCKGDSAIVRISGVYDSLLVNETLSSDTFTLKQDSVLLISGKNICGTKTKTVHFVQNPLPIVDLGVDKEICTKKETIILPEEYSYLWQDGRTWSSYVIDKSGEFSVLATDSNLCVFRDTINLVLKQFDSVSVLKNSKICPNQPLQVNIEKGHDTYRWADGDSAANRTLGVGNYSVTIETKSNDSICYTQTYDFEVTVWELTIPNVITPNDDNKNEYFVIKGLDDNYPMHVEIYNRWGKRVFRDDDYKNTWGNLELSDGVYYYQTSVGDFDCVKTKGFIAVIR